MIYNLGHLPGADQSNMLCALLQAWEILTEEEPSIYHSSNQLVSPTSRTPELHSFCDELRNVQVSGPTVGEMHISQTVSRSLCSISF